MNDINYYTELNCKLERMPVIEEFEKLRTSGDNYLMFMEHFVSCIVGKDTFKKFTSIKTISDLVSVSDEAMAMLILKNNYDVWIEIAGKVGAHESTAVKVDNCQAKQLYFSEGKGKGKSWSNEGKKYFNYLCEKIREDRKERGSVFDKQYLENVIEYKFHKKTKKISGALSNVKEKITCYNDYEFADSAYMGGGMAALPSGNLDDMSIGERESC
jgi:hypothetical protein